MNKKLLFRKIQLMLRICFLMIPMYILVMLVVSQFFIANPEFFFTSQVSAGIINPFENNNDGGTNDFDNMTDYVEYFKQFEADVFILSGHESHDLFLSARPGNTKSQIYRNFSIYIFSNMPCFYEIKIDEQLYQRGYSEFKTVVKASSPYEDMVVSVRIINQTNVSLPLFMFSNIILLDSPWDIITEEGEGGLPAEEWVRFSRGEFTTWVIMRIIIDIGFVFMGVVAGTSYATLHADLRGIEQVI